MDGSTCSDVHVARPTRPTTTAAAAAATASPVILKEGLVIY